VEGAMAMRDIHAAWGDDFIKSTGEVLKPALVA
jgi:hypothetical protein